MTDKEIIDEILRREGGVRYTNDPSDLGGPTKYGITLRTLADWRKKPVTAADVQALDEPEARQIYVAKYLKIFDGITNRQVRALCVDIGVNSGPSQAILMLQKTLGVKQDGVLGPVTLAAANSLKIKDLVAERILFYAGIVQRSPSQLRFLRGWVNRSLEFV